MQRQAIWFTVKSGSEEVASDILKSYPSPETRIDDHSRLLGTTVFRKDNIFVRVMEYEGDMATIASHLANQPVIQDVERQLNEHLEIPRDLSSPEGAREFFKQAMMKVVTHREAGRKVGDK